MDSMLRARDEAERAESAAKRAFSAAEQIRDEAEDLVREAADKAIAEKMGAIDNLIPKVEQMLDKNAGAPEHEQHDERLAEALKLFLSLRALGESLPETARTDFMQSSNRIRMDYIIGRLSGKKGLLKTSQEMRDSGAVTDFVKESEVPVNIKGRRLADMVLKGMGSFIDNLEDKDLSIGLSKIVNNVISRL